MYLKGYDLENLKHMLLHHFDDPLAWKQSKMAALKCRACSMNTEQECLNQLTPGPRERG